MRGTACKQLCPVIMVHWPIWGRARGRRSGTIVWAMQSKRKGGEEGAEGDDHNCSTQPRPRHQTPRQPLHRQRHRTADRHPPAPRECPPSTWSAPGPAVAAEQQSWDPGPGGVWHGAGEVCDNGSTITTPSKQQPAITTVLLRAGRSTHLGTEDNASGILDRASTARRVDRRTSPRICSPCPSKSVKAAPPKHKHTSTDTQVRAPWEGEGGGVERRSRVLKEHDCAVPWLVAGPSPGQ